ncbi:hypothetical protein BKA65DRAFT_374357, partial [Rhexocercosporidium sp. MPI-PUGE-AT-0058]
ETTPWLRYTRWPEQFRERPLDVITAASCQPDDCPIQDFALGVWAGETVTSSLADEIKIRQLLRLLDQVFDRCEVTLASTPHVLRCWLKGYHQHRFYLKPFQPLQRLATKQRYRLQWKRFLSFVFRTWAVLPTFRDEIYGVQYNELQSSTMGLIWSALLSLGQQPASLDQAD